MPAADPGLVGHDDPFDANPAAPTAVPGIGFVVGLEARADSVIDLTDRADAAG